MGSNSQEQAVLLRGRPGGLGELPGVALNLGWEDVSYCSLKQ